MGDVLLIPVRFFSCPIYFRLSWAGVRYALEQVASRQPLLHCWVSKLVSWEIQASIALYTKWFGISAENMKCTTNLKRTLKVVFVP